MSAADADRRLVEQLGPFAVGKASPAGQAIIARASEELDASLGERRSVLLMGADERGRYAFGWYCERSGAEIPDALATERGEPVACPEHGTPECLAYETWDVE